MESPLIGFVPLGLSHLVRDTAGLLGKGISKMERERSWSGRDGIAEMLGTKGSSCVEEVLAKGGTALEVGGGKMITARELSRKHPGGKLIIVEPFVDQNDLANLPENMKVVAKKLEEASDDIGAGSIDVAFSGGHVLNYVEDKLRFLEEVWRSLRAGGKAYIEFFGSPISPTMEQVMEKFGLRQSLNVTNLGGSIKVLEMTKRPGCRLSFGKYKLETSMAGNFPGDVNSVYQFVEE